MSVSIQIWIDSRGERMANRQQMEGAKYQKNYPYELVSGEVVKKRH